MSIKRLGFVITMREGQKVVATRGRRKSKASEYAKHVVVYPDGGCHPATPQEVAMWRRLVALERKKQ